MTTGRAIPIEEATQVGEARRAATELGKVAGLPERRLDELALVVTELGTNLLRHAGRGTVVLRHAQGDVDVLALDRGPGIADVGTALRDGTSTVAGGAGLGLGAIQRLSDAWDVHTAPGRGTALLARFHTPDARPPLGGVRIGALELPYPGEPVSGDALWYAPRPGGARLAVVDGLGHGPEAAAASRAALAVLQDVGASGPAEALAAMDRALTGLRGAAASVVDLDAARGRLVFAGAGNVAVSVIAPDRTRALVNVHGTLGVGVSGLREEELAWAPRTVVVVQSDGTSSRWDAGDYAGLARKDPTLIAGLLWRDHGGRRDDVTVAVAVRDVAG